jgi:hypothetical protein
MPGSTPCTLSGHSGTYWSPCLGAAVVAVGGDTGCMDGARTTSGQTLRERVLDALEHFWCPLRADEELHPYLEGTWGLPVTTDALVALLAAERQAFDQAVARPVWICLGLWPDGHGEPGWWTRSDWPLWVRVVDRDGEQARRCWLLRQLYRAPVVPDDPADR